jgi:hypothetical protein
MSTVFWDVMLSSLVVVSQASNHQDVGLMLYSLDTRVIE